jgi:hypothetical protein
MFRSGSPGKIQGRRGVKEPGAGQRPQDSETPSLLIKMETFAVLLCGLRNVCLRRLWFTHKRLFLHLEKQQECSRTLRRSHQNRDGYQRYNEADFMETS